MIQKKDWVSRDWVSDEGSRQGCGSHSRMDFGGPRGDLCRATIGTERLHGNHRDRSDMGQLRPNIYWMAHLQKMHEDVKIGVNWYRHSRDHKYYGFAICLYFFSFYMRIDFILGDTEYQKIFGRYGLNSRLIPYKKIDTKRKTW